MIGGKIKGVFLSEGADIVSRRGCIVYPTETFFALGGDAMDPGVAEQVIQLKARPQDKPFPLIIGDIEMLSLVSDVVADDILFVASQFWPGPISILVPGKGSLPVQVMDREGLVCVRWSSHPTASALSRLTQRPLIATSANRSGMAPAAAFDGIDSALLAHTQGVIIEGPQPQGGLPSTIIRCVGPKRLQLIREGVISRQELESKGFLVR